MSHDKALYKFAVTLLSCLAAFSTFMMNKDEYIGLNIYIFIHQTGSKNNKTNKYSNLKNKENLTMREVN